MIASDWHVHSRNSCDCKTGPIPATMAETFQAMRANGIRDFGLTDHLHSRLQLPDLEAARREFDSLPPDARMHFGVEVSCMSAWELATIDAGGYDDAIYGIRSGGPAGGDLAIALTADDRARLGIEYVVGGTHWPMYVPLKRDAVIGDYHRQNMFLACHPLVDIVAHPWWWMGHWQEKDGVYRTDPWFDDFRKVPQSLHDEFAAAVREHGTVVEINLYAMLLNRRYPDAFKRQYVEYLAGLKAAGVTLSIGSDHHAQSHHYDGDPLLPQIGNNVDRERAACAQDVAFNPAVALLDSVGIRGAELWCLPPRS